MNDVWWWRQCSRDAFDFVLKIAVIKLKLHWLSDYWPLKCNVYQCLSLPLFFISHQVSGIKRDGFWNNEKKERTNERLRAFLKGWHEMWGGMGWKTENSHCLRVYTLTFTMTSTCFFLIQAVHLFFDWCSWVDQQRGHTMWWYKQTTLAK